MRTIQGLKKLWSYMRTAKFKQDWKRLIERIPDPENPVKALLIITGVFFNSLWLVGALIGYARAYDRFARSKDETPRLHPNPPIFYVAMLAGALAMHLISVLLVFVFKALYGSDTARFIATHQRELIFFVVNGVIVILAFAKYNSWRNGIMNYLDEKTRFGSARFSHDDELEPYLNDQTKSGFFIGDQFIYSKQGHLLTTAGTRGGKGVNIILPNLLGVGGFKGSWVVIDPKGENAAVSARIQREKGRKVVILNPWDLLNLGSDKYNPLDLLDPTSPNVIDDVQLIAETIVPTTSKGDVDHFNARARTIISGLILHLITSDNPNYDKTLATIWEWLREPIEKWNELLVEMKGNTSKNGGEICEKTADEILALMENGSREYASVMSTAQKWTDYLKSPALRASMNNSSFKAEDLTSGNVTLYIIIPADRLKTHYQWLRLIVSALMRSVIRKPDQRVCFLLDEFYALGYLSEIEVALGAYAGYGVSVWAILQNLVQLRDMYDGNWENFISSCAVRHFFNLNDNTTLEYVSKLFGQKSIPTYQQTPTGMQVSGATARPLITTDELRRASANVIFTLVDQLPVSIFPKVPYYTVLTEGKDFDPNPYHKE